MLHCSCSCEHRQRALAQSRVDEHICRRPVLSSATGLRALSMYIVCCECPAARRFRSCLLSHAAAITGDFARGINAALRRTAPSQPISRCLRCRQHSNAMLQHSTALAHRRCDAGSRSSAAVCRLASASCDASHGVPSAAQYAASSRLPRGTRATCATRSHSWHSAGRNQRTEL